MALGSGFPAEQVLNKHQVKADDFLHLVRAERGRSRMPESPDGRAYLPEGASRVSYEL